MPQTDHPLAFGQHSNSDMAASIDDANTLIDVLVSLQPRVVKVRRLSTHLAPISSLSSPYLILIACGQGTSRHPSLRVVPYP
jgi:hypothetical protein